MVKLPRFNPDATVNPSYQAHANYHRMVRSRKRRPSWRILWYRLAFDFGVALVAITVAFRIGQAACR
jgi:hypothetical protein